MTTPSRYICMCPACSWVFFPVSLSLFCCGRCRLPSVDTKITCMEINTTITARQIRINCFARRQTIYVYRYISCGTIPRCLKEFSAWIYNNLGLNALLCFAVGNPYACALQNEATREPNGNWLIKAEIWVPIMDVSWRIWIDEMDDEHPRAPSNAIRKACLLRSKLFIKFMLWSLNIFFHALRALRIILRASPLRLDGLSFYKLKSLSIYRHRRRGCRSCCEEYCRDSHQTENSPCHASPYLCVAADGFRIV